MLGKKATQKEIEEALKLKKEKHLNFRRIGKIMGRSSTRVYNITKDKTKTSAYPRDRKSVV